MKKTAQRDLFPGALEMMILGMLKRQPFHGYALNTTDQTNFT
jgi:hypothetical protein